MNVNGWPAACATAFAALLKSCCKASPLRSDVSQWVTREIVPRHGLGGTELA
jgi:hypothetical protein